MSNQSELTSREDGSTVRTGTPTPGAPVPGGARPQLKNLALLTGLLLICFAKPLYDLFRFAIRSDLFSHVLLIPIISAYLVSLKKDKLQPSAPNSRLGAFGWASAAILVLASYWAGSRWGIIGGKQDYLAWTTLSCVLFFIAICFWCLDRVTLRTLAFPLAFLIFAVPFPLAVVDVIEAVLQHASAFCANVMFNLSGMSILRDGLQFQLPGIHLEVAPECSGIHSTLVLFISSLVAGHLFLRGAMDRSVLALVVIPLGILRNGFRIWTIGELCVHVSPTMIDSPIHRRGGPLFFALSLIPFVLLLLWLRRRSQRAASRDG
jgi:exosortase C (VPDSG-CTERM-specific)